MGAIRTVKVNNGQKYLLTETMGPEGERDIQILARPTASATLTEGAIVGKEYRFYLNFSLTMPPGEGSATAATSLTFQPMRDYTYQVDILATIYGGKQSYGEFSVKIGNQTLLQHADAYTILSNETIYGTGLSIYFYVGKDHKLRAIAQRTSVTNYHGTYVADAGTYTTAQLEAGAGTELGISAPTSLLIGPWGGDFSLNYYRKSYYDGDPASGQSPWAWPWLDDALGMNGMTLFPSGNSTWRVPYNTYPY